MGIRLADAQSPKDIANSHFQRGNQLHRSGDYKGALAEYQKARELFPSHKIDFNIARTLLALGQTIEAAQLFDQFLEQSADVAEATMLNTARLKLKQLNEQLASIRLKSEHAGALVFINNEVFGHFPLPQRIYVYPGKYNLLVKASGYTDYENHLDLNAGDHPILNIQLKKSSSIHQKTPEASVTSPPLAIKTEKRETPPRKGNSISTWAWISLTGAGAALTAGIIFGALATKEHNEYQTTNDAFRFDQLKESVPQKQLVANIMFGTAGALAITSTVLFLINAQEPSVSSQHTSLSQKQRAGLASAHFQFSAQPSWTGIQVGMHY